MHSKRATTAGVGIATLAVLAAACGGSSSGPNAKGTASGAPTSKTVQPAANAALTGIVNASDKKGGTLRVQASSDFDSLDPARTYYAYSFDFQRLWQRTLMAFAPAAGADSTKVVPDIATGPGASSNGGKTWTYKLRQGVKFEDGTAVTSKDIKYAVERVFAQDVITGGPSSYYIALLDNGQKYTGPYKDTDPNKLGLKSVVTPDDSTIVFNLARPFTDWDYLMALPVSTPVEKSVDQDNAKGGAKYQFHPQSVGPYKIASYSPGKSLKLVRNDAWQQSTDPLRKALPDTVNLVEGLDPVVMDNNLLAGNSDLTIDGFGLQQATVSKVLTNPTYKKNTDTASTGFVRYISIQEKVPPFNNVHCRRAVQYAADKVALQYARGGPIAGGDIATNMLVPTLPSFEQSYNPYPSGSDNKGDVTKAKQELQACGKPGGFSTNIATTNKGKGPLVATALQQGLAKAGIKANIIQVDASTYYSGFIGSPTNVHSKALGLAVAGWGPDYPSEYGFWESIVDGRAIKQQGNSNYAELNDQGINGDIDKALTTTDRNQRLDIWKDLSHKVMDSADYLPFVWDKGIDYHPPTVTNIYFDNALGLYDYMNLGVTNG